ncbi:thiosulfate sulfurtransferase/rhodanese-like domain-containing protein 3 isoform X2 [Belonocnema kinseyi]|uniref:thiosulfate sulfurtransferase/rhodanese-like domain-containing protein 3 isoform X2 n=2 Tax=Belonocnema kinseyi TaxID=2817044 RepID=UPI00143CC1DF|nr:thiosulfate sulfurtransferase/rhodanese-like domain-containing protein 3 isoform X2 [Belonocnema kinseyi]XP_033231427.1 thiosulfate sulfurtransferase/rhodanese-like domain-containing protein 3 isoform X2 [Belonocnema kinseyi]XP_033231428.1 thiosulfate sulfurtransferase/rhodanese-like domain-containing protein 3 isoform X2 [Belonocnema kinseyi]XP_033231429.1 thiosulfate sulfurtransferase/rhodanese-like domain-containing protein 3 isoform X2 [Belonocnema kinseyi]
MANSGAGDVKILDMNYEQLLEAQKDKSVLIIDVREQSEIDKTGALPGSIHIPMGQVANELTSLSAEDFENKYKKPLPSESTKLVLSCMAGRRSATVQDQIQKLGYKK